MSLKLCPAVITTGVPLSLCALEQLWRFAGPVGRDAAQTLMGLEVAPAQRTSIVLEWKHVHAAALVCSVINGRRVYGSGDVFEGTTL